MRTLKHPKAVELTQALKDFGFEDARSAYGVTYRARKSDVPWKEVVRRLEEQRAKSRGVFMRWSDPRAGGRHRHKFEVSSNDPEVLKAFCEIAGDIVPGATVTFAPNRCIMTITWTE